jgi:hypothetical protein
MANVGRIFGDYAMALIIGSLPLQANELLCSLELLYMDKGLLFQKPRSKWIRQDQSLSKIVKPDFEWSRYHESARTNS